ncbi:interferon gamma receptor 1-like isoform X2 [Macrotis lagotis]|uniref:interferon gamma receptor 1-like isoform X2 n=1 Tax=Macrotis lagotis TaxID=92651 RepID=UPI003D68D9A7
MPTPTNVEIKSYNLNPEVIWNYQIMSETPTFTVQLMEYGDDEWSEVCTNISHHSCNIFGHIIRPRIYYWARVKATIGQKESTYAESKPFLIYRDGKTGPPKLKIQEKNHHLIIDLYHPLIIVKGEVKGTVCDYYDIDDYDPDCSIFYYNVYLKINESMIIKEKSVYSCNDTQCQLIMPIVSFNSTYCVTAQGTFQNSQVWEIKYEKSKELCITSPNGEEEEKEDEGKDSSMLFLIIFICIAFVLCAVLIPYLVWKRKMFQRKNFNLPKSLISVVRTVHPHNILVINSEPKCISVVETSSYLAVPESEEKTSINFEDNKEKSEHFQEISSMTEEKTTEENVTEMTSDSHQSTMLKESYFHSNSNQAESGSLISNSCLPIDDSETRLVESCSIIEPPQSDPETRTDTQDITPWKNISSGYDKPHVLVVSVDMLTDTNDKESLIGYRPSEPFMEIL